MSRTENAVMVPSITAPLEFEGLAQTPRFVEAGRIAVATFKGVAERPVLQFPLDDGRMTAFLSRGLPSVVALSDNRGGLELVARRLQRSGDTRPVLVEGSLSSLPFPDEAFAGVISVEYFGHVREPVAVLKDLLRVCARGGHVVADFMGPQDSTRRLPGMRSDVDGGYMDSSTGIFHRYMDRWKLEEILRAAGVRDSMFEIIEKNWEGDTGFGTDDVLSRRHSLVAVAHRA